MKRDWDLIRELLIKVEELEPGKALRSEDYEEERRSAVVYHVDLLNQWGLIKANVLRSKMRGNNPGYFLIDELTMSGHDFLESIRNQSVWNKIKRGIGQKGSAVGVEIIKAWAVEATTGF